VVEGAAFCARPAGKPTLVVLVIAVGNRGEGYR